MVVRQTLPTALQQFVGSSATVGTAGTLGDVNDLAKAVAQLTGLEVEDPITASTIQTLAGAFQLNATLNHISVANNNDAVKLPASLPGTLLLISNSSTNTILLFPQTTTDAINAAGAGNSVSIANATTSVYFCSLTGQWWGGAITNEA